MPAISTTQPIHLLIFKIGGEDAYTHSSSIHELDRRTVVRDLADCQYEINALQQVIEVDMATNRATDITDAICKEVMHAWADRGPDLPDWKREWVELHVSPQAAQSFRREAA